MTRNFWHTTVQGGYCTHGETFLPGTQEGEKATRTGEKDVVWWAKGGRLNGESPARIAFLREIIESLPGPLEPMNGRSGWFGKDDDEILEICAQAPVSAYSCSVLCGWINGSGTTSTVLSFNTADVAVTWHFYSTRMTNAVR